MAYFRVVSCLAVALLFAASGPASRAEYIVNGNFSNDFSSDPVENDWHTDSEFGSAPRWKEGYVEFAEGNQLQQLFDLPANASFLSFEYKLIQTGDGVSDKTPDSFQATLYNDQFDPLLGFPTGFFTVDHVGSYFDPNYVTVEAANDSWQRVTLNLASLAPMDGLLLEFLVNPLPLDPSADGRTTTALVDNVVSSVIPEPTLGAAFIGMCLTALAIRATRRTRRR